MGEHAAVTRENGDEQRMGEMLSSTLVKCSRTGRSLVHAAPATSGNGFHRGPKNWVTTSVAMNFFLLFAMVYYEWSRADQVSSSRPSSVHLRPDGPHLSTGNVTPVIVTPGIVTNTSDACSGHGFFEQEYETGMGTCRCHACFTGKDCSTVDTGCVIDLYQGDPTMFEHFWRSNGKSCETVILGWQRMSYYANSEQFFFIETELDHAIRSLHHVVGNAVTEGRHIVIGVGSTQLFQAALYALSSPTRSTPASVISLAPYYSSYPTVTDFLRSALYRWAGDAAAFQQETGEDSAYIELVTSPNNPTGEVRYPAVKGTGALVHDLAYYWPHYTPITAPADDDLMLFTVSKSTGHAGTRIGWAIVKDLTVAQKMAKFIELNTIGVSKDAQIRATQILRSVTKAYRGGGSISSSSGASIGGKLPHVLQRTSSADVSTHVDAQALFHFGSSEMAYRWSRLRSALKSGVRFSLPEFQPAFCKFFGQMSSPTPAFAWLRCNHEGECEKFLKVHGILTRSGVYFGANASYVRLSMLDRRPSFEILVDRLEALEQQA